MSTSDEDQLSRSFQSFGLGGSQSGFSNDVPYSYSPFNYDNHSDTSTSSYSGYGASYNPFDVSIPHLPVEDPSVWVHRQFPIHGVTVGRDQQCY